MKKLSVSLLLAFLLTLLPGVVLAIGNPENGVTIEDTYVFRDVFEDDDQLYFVRYDVSYDPIPDENPDDTWQMSLYDEDNILVESTPLNYFQHNIISIYLEPSEALTWESSSTVRIMGMPSVFGSLVEGTNLKTSVLSPELYLEATDLGETMVDQAEILDTDWGITLLTTRDKLNSTGGDIFEKACPYLSTAVPEIFETVVRGIPVNYVDYPDTYTETLKENAGPKLTAAITDIGNAIGLSYDWLVFWIFSVFFLIVVAAISTNVENPGWGLVAGFPVLVGGAYLMGGGLFTLVMVIAAIATILFALYFILGRFA